MSKAKMKFPRVPGDTPRERFMNLARHLITIPKTAISDSPQRAKRRRKTVKRSVGKILLLVMFGSLLSIRGALAEDAEHAALRLATAAGNAANASEKVKDPVVRHQLVMQQFANMLVSCELIQETPHGTDPDIMTRCADMQARFKKHFDRSDQLEIEGMMAHLRISTLK
jgi:hypothetical protein